MSPRAYTQNNNITIKWCTYLSKPMLRHHNPAKPDHSIKKIIKKKTLRDMCYD
jgi:hypothetical protein